MRATLLPSPWPGRRVRVWMAMCSWLSALAHMGGCGETDAPAALGAACERDDDCEGLLCGGSGEAFPTDLSDLTLACLSPVGAGEPGERCTGPDDCDRRLCLLTGVCARACAQAEDCGDAARCQLAFTRTHGGDVLQRLSACVPTTHLPDSVEVTRRRLEDAVSGGIDTLTLAGTDRPSLYVIEHLDDGSWPTSMVCRPPLCPVALASLADDDGASTTLFEREASEQPPAATPVATLDSAFPITVYVGNGPQAVYSQAGYALTVASEQPGDVAVTRIRGSASPDNTPGAATGGGRLDLNVFYLGALDWMPTGARGPALLAEALDVVDEIFEPAGIFVGEVRQYAVPGALGERGVTFEAPDDPGAGFRVLARRFGVWPELPALLRLSAGAPGPAVNLFFVRDIAGMGAGEVRALSGGTPGPLGMHGTGASGIAIATDMMAEQPGRLGRTLAHELGHYLGLFHTSERGGAVLDPFPDTGSCTLDRDSDGDGVLDASECAGAGDDNLMFWANTDAVDLSAQQIEVLQQAMVLR